jgi:hypothetical protein
MADELPDDPEHWPSDPYALLGVGWEVDVRELRKRYGQLIRRYKPEQRPEEFRRIREAYDRILAQATMRDQWRSMAFPAPNAEPPPPPSNPPPAPIIDAPIPSRDLPDDDHEPPAEEPAETPEIWNASPERWTPPPPRRPLASELERLWALAEIGMVDEAYRGLRELEREHPGSRELAVRRYWLVTAFRELEPAHDPLERVLRMLVDDSGLSPLWNEVRLRGQFTPNWTFSPLFDELIDAARSPIPLSILYDIRWQAALQIGSWRLMLEDVPGARRRFRDHPAEWTRMLLQVVDRIAWIGEPVSTQALGEFVVEIERGAKGDRTLDADLHRLDFLRDLVAQWLRRKPKSALEAALLDFVALSWRGRWETVRAHLIALCGHLADNLKSSMRLLDEWAGDCPLVLAQLVRAINEGDHLNRPRQAEAKDACLTFLDFLVAAGGAGAASRISLVHFFRDEQILPEDLRSAFLGQTVPANVTATLDQIEADWVVRVLARAAVCTAA